MKSKDHGKYYEKVGSDAFDISEEILFELPDSWKWIRFGCLVRMNIGKTPARGVTKYWENGVHNWVAISDMSDYSHMEKPHAFDPRGHSGADPVKTFSSDP